MYSVIYEKNHINNISFYIITIVLLCQKKYKLIIL